MVTISVLIPARDAAPYLASSLECILAQDDFGLDLEVVVIDDGSEDDTLSLAQGAGAQDPRVRVVALPRRGISAALNAGLARAEGRYVARMDADDLCPRDRLRAQLRHLERHPGLDVVGTRVRMFPADEVTRNMEAYLGWQNRLLIHRAVVRNLLVECPLTHATAMFRREALEKVGGWREVDGPEDLDLFLRGAEAGWRFGKVNRELYHWREREDRATRIDPRLTRSAFRRVAMDACGRSAPRGTAFLVWGWGRSLEDWDEGLRSRGFRVRSVEVNPRQVRGDGVLPALPEPAQVGPPPFAGRGGALPARIWLLAYGSARSRRTVQGRMAERGYQPGIHYAPVS
jgi:glycosyltransferase involved in cell wall biosynthesis